MSADFETYRAQMVRDTEYVVDATGEESFLLWWKWCHVLGVPHTEYGTGWLSRIGSLGEFPVNVHVSWMGVAGHLVAFVDPCSRVVDYDLVSKWEGATFPCLRIAHRHTDATNFGNVILDIRRRGTGVPMRDEREVVAALKGIATKT